ncbi:MAG: hypothetical protein A2V88_02715 [Elusimicrobia bacterium RBG_16_66_12]|nr:MAG: hypothetical protein A2V88_02715 [Elusimicrobia bacterium RBG_16_66_12]
MATLVVLGALLSVVGGTALAQSGAPPAATIPGGAVVLGVVSWLVGFAIKKWEKAYNFIIGWVVLALSLVGYSVVPAEASVVGFFGLGELKGLGVGLAAALQTAVVTGVHSWILHAVVNPLTGRLSKATTYLPGK